MTTAPLTFAVVREMALEMSCVESGTAYGAPAVKVNGNLLACVPVNKSAEPDSAAFRIDVDLRSSLIQAKPDIYYVTDHYVGYPMVLVRLSKISRREVRELLGLSWNFVSAKKSARASEAKAKPKLKLKLKLKPKSKPRRRQHT
jgi:hypothetical protein